MSLLRFLGVILGIETSCDDTCAAVVTREGVIRSNVISSQGIHDRYGGVVPEVAARHHLELIDAVTADALGRAGVTLDEITLVGATCGPGLIGALLVGLASAKAIAAAGELPFAAVDHLHGHVAAAFLEPDQLDPPFVSLIASGGHTLLLRVTDRRGEPEVLARTLDDAAGEAFDKGARMLGLGYPGGAALERLARDGDPHAFSFPTGRTADFSFAGLKTALLYKIRDLGGGAAGAGGGAGAVGGPGAGGGPELLGGPELAGGPEPAGGTRTGSTTGFAPTWPRPTSGRSSGRSSSGSRQSSGRPDSTAWQSAGEWRPTGPSAGRSATSGSGSRSRRPSCAPTTLR